MGRSPKPRKSRQPRKSKPATLTIAIGGEGVTLKDVSLRQLSELLEATASTIEAVAQEKQLPVPNVALTKARSGSAAYELVSEDQGADRVWKSVLQVVKDRGKDSSPRTRRGMSRMLQAAGKTGPLRFEPEATTLRPSKPVYLAAPLDEHDTTIEEGTIVFGRVIALRLDGERGSVTIRYDDGGRGDFAADVEMIGIAANHIGKAVEARVTFERGEQRDWEGTLEGLAERPGEIDLIEAFASARQRLAERGVIVDAAAWHAADRDDA